MILGILQARVSSTRLPGKVLKPILGKPMLLRQLERVRRAKSIDKIIVATSTEGSDDAIEALCRLNNVSCFRGNLEDVLDRYYQAAKPYMPAHVVRLTGDCPLADPVIIDRTIAHHLQGNYDYTSNTSEPTFPDGLDVEVVKFSSLKCAWLKAILPSQREHVTQFFYSQPNLFKLGLIKNEIDFSHLRWTVDEQADFDLVDQIYQGLYETNQAFGFSDILTYLASNPNLATLNAKMQRNVGLQNSLLADEIFLKENKKKIIINPYKKSQELLEKAVQYIPLGAQTFSKSTTQFPLGISPHFLERGKGSHVWDIDGNKYIDFINGLAAINLGYNDPDVNQAVLKQFESGVSFSLSHPIEVAVAEKIVEMVPCAEMVRFGKNGSDVTAGAIRIARAHTGRDHVAVCGYHGWQDWYIGSTSRNLGVPEAMQELVHPFIYNDLVSLQKIFDDYPEQVAAVILEPMNMAFPAEGFLQGVQQLAKKHGAILVFDEVVTGFRFANGGAQALFGVVPDLAAFGKGIANGYPLSALAGSKQLMLLMEKIFFSFTFGGESLSLAAAYATLHKLQNNPIIAQMTSLGEILIAGIKSIIQRYDLGHIFNIVGHPTWSFLTMQAVKPHSVEEIKTLWMQEILARGILSLGTHNLSYAHTEQDVNKLLTVYEEVLPFIGQVASSGELTKFLRCKPLTPLFKVR